MLGVQKTVDEAKNPVLKKAAEVTKDKQVELVAMAIEAVDLTETADVRQVYALPAKSFASGIELEPGIYSFTVKYLSGNSVVAEENFDNIEVKAGIPTLVETNCQK